MRPLPRTTKTTKVSHIYPGYAQLAYAIYDKKTIKKTIRVLSTMLSIPYMNLNRRMTREIRRLVTKEGEPLVKVVKNVRGENIYIPTKPWTPERVRRELIG